MFLRSTQLYTNIVMRAAMPRRIIAVRSGGIPAKKEYCKIWKRNRIVQLKNVKDVPAQN
jgi:hypothetical protein